MLLENLIPIILFIVGAFFFLRILFHTSLLYFLRILYLSIEENLHAHQFFKVPHQNEHKQENQLYRKVHTYLTSSISLEESDFTNLVSSGKSNEIVLSLSNNQIIHDSFLGSKVSWIKDNDDIVLKIRRRDKRRILRPYLQHIHAIAEEVEQRRNEVKLYLNSESNPTGCWRSVLLTHPATIETVVLDDNVKARVKSDLELFLRSKQYYHRLGRVWKRSYLLYGPSGTGKSTFVAAMARFLSYDIYNIDLSRVSDDMDLKLLLLQTTNKSLILIEDLDRLLTDESSNVSFSGVLNFMDGIVSSCGEERVMVFTMNRKDQIDESVLRPGRIDVHIHFPLCDFSAFKILANSHLGLKDHKLFAEIEERFHSGVCMSPAEIGEIMISNRNSPSRALKTVISALQNPNLKETMKIGRRLTESPSSEPVEPGSVVCRESVHVVREFRKLYGLLRMRSGRKEPAAVYDLRTCEKDASLHGNSTPAG